MYNFSIPSQLKAWIGRLAVPGKTFRYAKNGPEGLAGGKTVIVASSCGRFSGSKSPLAFLDHQETYLRGVFGFFGITDLVFVRPEGVNVGPDRAPNRLTPQGLRSPISLHESRSFDHSSERGVGGGGKIRNKFYNWSSSSSLALATSPRPIAARTVISRPWDVKGALTFGRPRTPEVWRHRRSRFKLNGQPFESPYRRVRGAGQWES
jgi:hypothetical protein